MDDFGLVGHPVGHSMSKVMHEAAFKELGLPYSYGLFDVTEDKLKQFMEKAKFRGLNVTIPHKVAVIPYLSGLSREAQVIGSVNTVEFNGEKRIGHNTDVLGFMNCVREAGVDLADKSVLVVGSGGAGRGIVFKLAIEKHTVFSFDVDRDKSERLCSDVLEKVGVRVNQAREISDAIGEADVLVNATPVGMHPNIGDTPIPTKLLDKRLTVVDIVYNPTETRLLREAKAKGCRTVGGVGMLVHQGAESLRIWLGVEPPVEAMRKAVLSSLK